MIKIQLSITEVYKVLSACETAIDIRRGWLAVNGGNADTDDVLQGFQDIKQKVIASHRQQTGA